MDGKFQIRLALRVFLSCLGLLPWVVAPVRVVRGSELIRITDDWGQEVQLREPARRVIPLYGAFAEMLYAIGAGATVAARTQADRFPPDLLQLPSVGTHMKPNVEMILGLKPDLVIQSAGRREATPEIQRIQAAGVPLAVFDPKTFEQISRPWFEWGHHGEGSPGTGDGPAARGAPESGKKPG